MSHSESPIVSVVGEKFPWISFLGAAGSFLIFVIILCIAYIPKRSHVVDENRIKERLEILATARSKVKKEADFYGWIDQANGVVRLPVSRAMDLLVNRSQAPSNKLAKVPNQL